MFSVRRFDCFPLSKGDDTFWFGSKTVGIGILKVMRESFLRVGVRTYLLGGAIDGSEANGIIRDPNFLTLDENGISYGISTRSDAVWKGSCCLITSLEERQEVWNDCRSYKVRDGSNGNIVVEASALRLDREESDWKESNGNERSWHWRKERQTIHSKDNDVREARISKHA
ncbi:hypothetical protein Tco_0728605 [Tanacetum coccineum]|uniref:Uncharacterized protein n=1 Tax=Tanacetum coccineum TaxID=301880 RepID=A0ABQ4YLJ8_9ASTR